MLDLDWDSSYGSLYDYEEYPAKWCWLPPSLRRGPFSQEPPSDSEESPELTILEEERERRLYECKVQEKRPFFQKRIYGCCNMRRWHFILIFSLLLLSFSGLVGGSIYFSVTITNRMAEVKRLNMDIQEKQKQIDEKNLELERKRQENVEKQQKIDEIDLKLEEKKREMAQKIDEIDSKLKEKMNESEEKHREMTEQMKESEEKHREMTEQMKTDIQEKQNQLEKAQEILAATEKNSCCYRANYI
jgi:DNA repair exonuclease SbcCD ATPase subunit